jgi:hypothetical protein
MSLKIHPPGTPLRDDHPFSRPVILFGGKPKTSSQKSSPPEESNQSDTASSEEPIPQLPPDLEDIAFEILRSRYKGR